MRMEGRGGRSRWLWLVAGVALTGLVGMIATGAERLETMRMKAQQTARVALDTGNMLAPMVEVRDGTMVVSGAAASQAEKQAICNTVSDSLRAENMLGTPGVIARVACDITAPGDDATVEGGAVAGNGAGAGSATASATGGSSGVDAGATAGAGADAASATASPTDASGAAAGSTDQAAAQDCQTRLTATAATERVTFALNGNAIATGTTMLNQIAEVAKSCRQFGIEVGGHTDKRGGDALNVPLSQQRANAVRDYLISRGVDPAQLTARGYGSSRPVDASATADDEPRNRRTEFTITALN